MMALRTLDAVAGGASRRRLGGAAVAAALLVACSIPLWVTSYHVFQLTLVVINAIALLGLNLLTGYSGQISLGHGAFYGIGAYTTAILIHQWHFPYWLTLPFAGGVCLVLGFLFGLPAVRLEGLHLALATFALGVVLPQLLKYKGIEGLTGGVQGITLEKPRAPFGLPLSDDQWLYFFSLATAMVLFAAARNLVHGHTGRVIMAIRDRPIAAASAGIDTAMYKSVTFGISAMYTGVAGALSALAVQFVGPGQLLHLPVDRLAGRNRRGGARVHLGGDLRRAVHPVHPEPGGRPVEGRALAPSTGWSSS